MLSGYSSYLLNIRNNLIQCGVEVPVTQIQDYSDLCCLEQELDDILWFYRILAISGSEYALKDFFLPLNGYFKERMRSIYYQEFLDFLQDYKTIGVEEVRSKYLNSGGDAYKPRVNAKEETSQEDIVDNWLDSQEYDEDEDIDAWSDSPVEEVHSESCETTKSNEDSLVEFNNTLELDNDDPFGVHYESHGIYLEDLEDDEDDSNTEEEVVKSSNSEKGIDYDSHGVYIEDLVKEGITLNNNEEDSNLEDQSSQDELEDYYEEEDEEEYDDQDGLGGYYSSDEEESEEEDYEEDDQDGLGGYYSDEEEYEDQDELENYLESEDENEYDDQDGLGGYYEEDEEEYDDQDGLGGYYEEEYDDQDALGGYYEDEEEYDDQDGLGGYYQEEEETINPQEKPQEVKVLESSSSNSPQNITDSERDLSDMLQDFINGSLTSVRDSIRHMKKRKKQ